LPEELKFNEDGLNIDDAFCRFPVSEIPEISRTMFWLESTEIIIGIEIFPLLPLRLEVELPIERVTELAEFSGTSSPMLFP